MKRPTIDGTNQRMRWEEPDNPFVLLDKWLARYERMYRRGFVQSCIIAGIIAALLIFGKCF